MPSFPPMYSCNICERGRATSMYNLSFRIHFVFGNHLTQNLRHISLKSHIVFLFRKVCPGCLHPHTPFLIRTSINLTAKLNWLSFDKSFLGLFPSPFHTSFLSSRNWNLKLTCFLQILLDHKGHTACFYTFLIREVSIKDMYSLLDISV